MQGETLGEVTLSQRGVDGDRTWAIRDEVKGGIRGAKKIPGLMKCSARYMGPPQSGAATTVEVVLPDGRTCASDSPSIGNELSEALGRQVTLWPLQPETDLDHYRRGEPDHEDLEVELREIFTLLPEEGLPDLSGLPPEVFEYECPPGTYFDAFPLLVMTTSSLQRLAEVLPESKIDVRRFRPNLLIDTDGQSGFVESAWIGKRIRAGSCEIAVEAACPRCVMTTLPFDSLPKDPNIMRALVREADHNLGVYARVVRDGVVRVGDAVEIL